jgi:hypothetical protein
MNKTELISDVAGIGPNITSSIPHDPTPIV